MPATVSLSEETKRLLDRKGKFLKYKRKPKAREKNPNNIENKTSKTIINGSFIEIEVILTKNEQKFLEKE